MDHLPMLCQPVLAETLFHVDPLYLSHHQIVSFVSDKKTTTTNKQTNKKNCVLGDFKEKKIANTYTVNEENNRAF